MRGRHEVNLVLLYRRLTYSVHTAKTSKLVVERAIHTLGFGGSGRRVQLCLLNHKMHVE